MFADYLANPGHFPDPYPIFRAIRDVEPVHWSKAGVWVVLGHPEGRLAFLNSSLSRREATRVLLGRFGEVDASATDALDVWASTLICEDGTEHAHLRLLVSRAFSPKAIRQWENTIARCVSGLVEELRGRDAFDLLHDFAYRVPSSVIADILGVPREDHKLFEAWTSAWLSTNFTDPRAVLDSATVRPLEAFVAYVRALVSERRNRVAVEAEDLIGFLLNAEEQGGRLSERQLIAAIMILIIAGHETTANLISNGFFSLMRNPEQLSLLAANPDLIAPAVEECLRFETPARSQPRLATADVAIGDVVIKEGQSLQIHVGAANHDGRVFERPDAFDITRKQASHIAFGSGPHMCIGLHIARLEARHAIAALVNDVGRLRIARDVTWRNVHVRGLVALPVRRV